MACFKLPTECPKGQLPKGQRGLWSRRRCTLDPQGAKRWFWWGSRCPSLTQEETVLEACLCTANRGTGWWAIDRAPWAWMPAMACDHAYLVACVPRKSHCPVCLQGPFLRQWDGALKRVGVNEECLIGVSLGFSLPMLQEVEKHCDENDAKKGVGLRWGGGRHPERKREQGCKEEQPGCAQCWPGCGVPCTPPQLLSCKSSPPGPHIRWRGRASPWHMTCSSQRTGSTPTSSAMLANPLSTSATPQPLGQALWQPSLPHPHTAPLLHCLRASPLCPCSTTGHPKTSRVPAQKAGRHAKPSPSHWQSTPPSLQWPDPLLLQSRAGSHPHASHIPQVKDGGWVLANSCTKLQSAHSYDGHALHS